MSETELMGIQMPMGWAMLDNKFFDVDPIEDEDGEFIKNWHEGFIEDVLWIDEVKLENGKYNIVEKNFFSIDLGWYPDMSIDGKYTLTLKWISNDGIVHDIDIFRNRDRYKIRKQLHHWLNDVKKNYKKYIPDSI
ncbi:hypothetical protein [Flammeovirga agarivorans]|uniref:Uncharacterized protein n=1 Tax=Flammeovirga agarivorans TaxID=2726742 RepID=A0A7X8XZB5_9BACT|nr:hypothetical protein [Flammeovirga agarivorans]NLR95026.1 hypothetical protein [Flammeovirga agarivorans]